MVYQVGICDDSEADRNYIQDLARQWAAQRGHTLQIRSFASGEEFLFHIKSVRFMTGCMTRSSGSHLTAAVPRTCLAGKR